MNVVVLRLPNGKDVVFDRSGCPKCKKLISWYDNIPIFSFLFLRGKCRSCRTSISFQYPLFELWHGLLAFIIFYNWQVMGLTEFYISLCKFFIAAIFSAHILIDLKHQLLLDVLNLALLPFVIVMVWLTGLWQDSLVGAAVGFFFPLLVTWIFYLLRGKIGLGGGDIKLFGVLGALFGIKGVILNIFSSCILGSVVTITMIVFKKTKSDQYIPFGPYILIISLIQMLFPSYFALWQNFLIPY
tara:strand:+ start:107 stop:832 length:726 start_codon:yes stop_codon:yes gene_type:complete